MIGLIIFQSRGKIKLHPISKAFAIWLVFKIISILWSTNIATVRLYFISQVGMVLFLIVLLANPIDKLTLEWIKTVYWLSSAILGLLSIFSSRSYLGSIAVRQVVVIFGVGIDPNNQAALLLIGIGISLVHIFYEKKYIILSVVVFLVNSFGTFLTGSRAGFLTIILSILFIVFLPSKKQKVSTIIIKILLVLFAFAGILFIAQRFLNINIYNRLFSFDDYTGGSGRITLWRMIFEEYIKDPARILFGLGWGSYSKIVQIGETGSAHNTFLTILSDTGLIGFVIFMYPILNMLFSMIKERQQLPIMMVLVQFTPAFFIDSIHKRFFWNAIFILGLYYYSYWNNKALPLMEGIDDLTDEKSVLKNTNSV